MNSTLKTQNVPPKPRNPKSITQNTPLFPSLSRGLLLVLLLLLAIILIFSIKPLLALFHQGQAGRALGEVVAVGDNEYGGFACLRPFVEDLQQRESLQTALTHLRKAESFAPNQSHTYLLLGRTLCLLGDYESAIPAFQKFGELRPKNPLGYLEMGFALLQACPPNGKCPDGLNTYDAWRKAGVRAEDFLTLAERARQKEDYATALLWYQNAQRMGMELRSTVAYIRYLNLRTAGNEAEANQALKNAIDFDRGWLSENDRFRAWFRYGVVVYDQLAFDRAIKIFQKALGFGFRLEEVRRELSHVFRFLGLIAYQQDDLRTAKEYFAKALEVDSTNIWAHVHYGWCVYLIDNSNLDIALREFEIAVQLAGRQPIVWNDIVRHLIKWGEYNYASDYCRRASELSMGEQLVSCNLLKNPSSQ